jgi:hypothetical protein
MRASYGGIHYHGSTPAQPRGARSADLLRPQRDRHALRGCIHATDARERPEAQDAQSRAVIDGIIKAIALPGLVRFIRSYGDKRGGWVATTGKELGFGEDYWFRTAVNYVGIWWNNNREVVYFVGEADSSGAPLNGDNVYCLHFAPDDLPQNHVHAYWSLTLMTLPDYRVVPNPLGRFGLNNLSVFAYEPDGSLKLYLAAKPPAEAP